MEQKKRTGYPSIDKPWVKYYQDSAHNCACADESISTLMSKAAAKFLHLPAVRYYGSKNLYSTKS